ncbi:MAG: hypothetical protein ACYCW6_06855 [Candidatus Xenobia bacterium]
MNLISLETLVHGKQGRSDVEHLSFKALAAKGTIADLPKGAQRLDVTFEIPKFKNGAHVRLVVSQSTNSPEEIACEVKPESDSSPLSQAFPVCIAGHITRTRELWLASKPVSAAEIWPSFTGMGLTPTQTARLQFIRRMSDHSLEVALNGDEPRPASSYPVLNSKQWYFPGQRVTHYWRMAPNTWSKDLQVRIDGRQYYPGSHVPIIGNTVIEDFALQQTWKPGQTLHYGCTVKTPLQLGFTQSSPPAAKPKRPR